VDAAAKAAGAVCGVGSRCLPDLVWMDTDGAAHTKADLLGKVVVVNFWATWCHPCEREIPDFSRIATRYRKQVVVLGVMMDDPEPDRGTMLNFASDHEIAYPVIPVTEAIQLAFHHPRNYPTTYVFDRRGYQRAWKIRPMSEAELSAVIEEILSEAPRRSATF
jgi:thiol-disulfide isomerase/thioredoxin